MTTWCLRLFMTLLLVFQQTGLVQLSSSVNSCSTSDNQTSSQTNMTIDMNTVSSGHICLHRISLTKWCVLTAAVMTGSRWLVLISLLTVCFQVCVVSRCWRCGHPFFFQFRSDSSSLISSDRLKYLQTKDTLSSPAVTHSIADYVMSG